MALSKAINLFKSRSNYLQINSYPLLNLRIIHFKKGGSAQALSLFLLFVFAGIFLSAGCAQLGSNVERAGARKWVATSVYDTWGYAGARFLGVVNEWNVPGSEIYFESSLHLDANMTGTKIAVISRESGDVIAEGFLCGQSSRHFAVAKLDVIKGKPVAGDPVVSVSFQEETSKHIPSQTSE